MRCRLKKKKFKKNKLSRGSCWKFENLVGSSCVCLWTWHLGTWFRDGLDGLGEVLQAEQFHGCLPSVCKEYLNWKQRFYTQEPRTAPRGNCVTSTVAENRVISLHLPKNKTNFTWTPKNPLRITLPSAESNQGYRVLSCAVPTN